jgi:FtsP/CotA-like multicopper oxidase with cupredoxin domain
MKKSESAGILATTAADRRGLSEGDAVDEAAAADGGTAELTAAGARAEEEADGEVTADLALVPSSARSAENLVTPAMRQAAAERALALRTSPAEVEWAAQTITAALDPNAPPDYFGPYPNYANSPFPALDPVTKKVVPGSGMRKFFDSHAGVGPANTNNLHNYIPIATPDTITYPQCDYYEIALKRYSQKMSSDLPATQLQGYVQLNSGTDAQGHNTIAPPSQPYYLGPMIIARQGRPVRVKFINMLPAGSGGNLFLPVDSTLDGAGTGPLGGTEVYTQNRAVAHLHGGHTPWISDGTPYQWITPANETTSYPRGVSVQNVPDMPDPGPGAMTFFYTNQQSARLMWVHDHAIAITRLNVYSGAALPYELQDPVERDLVTSGVIPADEIPLVIQDKTFVPDDIQLAAQDPTWNKAKWGGLGSLWFPHVYMPNQNPGSDTGATSMGRWDYGPWFWPPYTALTHGPIPNPYFGPLAPWEPPLAPGTPTPTQVPEAFMDTPVINGTAYPHLKVQPKAYRFRILNASNDRSWNLQLYVAKSPAGTMWTPAGTLNDPDAGEVTMVEACPNPAFPPTWPTDGRAGGVPDPATSGPEMIQIGNDGGLLPAPAVLPNQPINYQYNRRDIVVLNVTDHTLLIGPGERADVIIDFSGFAGQNVIFYNDCPAPVPAFDPRYDYYTGDPDLVSSGGAESTQPGYGPNTRTVMQFQVQAGTPEPFDLASLQAQLPIAYGLSQNPPIVPEQAYDPAFGTTTPANTYARIQDNFLDWAGLPHPIPLQPKAIQELFDTDYGRLNSTLGTELPNTSAVIQTTLPFKYLDPPTEILLPSAGGAPLESPHDGTQIWKITHNGVDTHFVHFHLFDVQLVNRVGWDGAIRPPDANELGWKDTVRMNPLEDAIVAMRPTTPTLPFKVGDSVRALDPTRPLGTTTQFTGIDPYTGQPITVVNQPYNFGWEYVWHCHILGHEENDMMRPVVLTASPAAPSNLAYSVVAATSVRLTWTNNATWPAATSFAVQRATNAAFTQNVRSFTSGAGTTYTDATATPGTTYHYRVRAENDVAYSAWSNAVTVPLFATPPAPTNLAARVVVTGLTTASIVVTWAESASATVTGFTVERATNAAFTTGHVSTAVSAATRTYTFTGLNRLTTYHFRVRAVNGPVTSAWTTITVTAPF